MWVQMGTEHCLKRTDKGKWNPLPWHFTDLHFILHLQAEGISFLLSFLTWKIHCTCDHFSTFLWSLMLLLYLPEERTSSNGQIKNSLHATAILCTWSHWYTAWHCGRLRLESHCCSPFFSAVQLFEEPSWGKSGVIYPVYLKVASTWLVMIRPSSGKKRTNKWEMEKWFFANW